MTYYGGKELAASFRQVRGNTVQIAKDIPDSKYDFTPASDTKSIAQTLAHIALSPGYQQHIHANKIGDLTQVNFGELAQKFGAEEAKPRTKAEIVSMLETEGERFAAFLEGLSDAFLAELVAMPPGAQPPAKSRLEMLLSPKEHEMHHRGQLMLAERMLGIVPHLTRQRQQHMAQAQQTAQARQAQG